MLLGKTFFLFRTESVLIKHGLQTNVQGIPARPYFYVDSNQESMVVVYHPPGIGLDARVTTTIIQSIRRLQLIEIIRRFVLFIQGKELVYDLKMKGSMIDTGFIFELVLKHSHQDKRIAVAIGRDSYTPSSINAATQNGLRKASHELVAPNARNRYYKNKHHIDETVYKKEIRMSNLLSFANRKNINATLNTIFHRITNDNPNRIDLKNRWERLEQVICPTSVLLQLVQKKNGLHAVSIPVLNVIPRSIGPISNPNENDVLCGRGKGINKHAENVHHRSVIQSQKSDYLRQNTIPGKAHIVAGIVNTIRARNPAGCFLQQDKGTGMWFDIGDVEAMKKTRKAITDYEKALREGATDIRPAFDGG